MFKTFETYFLTSPFLEVFSELYAGCLRMISGELRAMYAMAHTQQEIRLSLSNDWSHLCPAVYNK